MNVYVVNHWAFDGGHGCEDVFAELQPALDHARRDVGKRAGVKGELGWVRSENGAVFGKLDDTGTKIATVSKAYQGREVEQFEVR